MPLTLVVVLDVPDDVQQAFQRYEAAVLPLLQRHGGRLERRLRTDDGRTEVHVLSFDDGTGYASYRADPDRLLQQLPGGVAVRVLTVTDVP